MGHAPSCCGPRACWCWPHLCTPREGISRAWSSSGAVSDGLIAAGRDVNMLPARLGRPLGTNRCLLDIRFAGWGGYRLLKDIDTSQNDVTVISPRDHFTCTPMLAPAAVGRLKLSHITEPLSGLTGKGIRHVLASATDIDLGSKKYDSLPLHLCTCSRYCWKVGEGYIHIFPLVVFYTQGGMRQPRWRRRGV